jgi:hypothetical protein
MQSIAIPGVVVVQCGDGVEPISLCPNLRINCRALDNCIRRDYASVLELNGMK